MTLFKLNTYLHGPAICSKHMQLVIKNKIAMNSVYQ